ncbi:MAG: aminotransferase class I/II-fold pyridoxal phosphate-dependent enzyme, partial [Pseudomonadales bacterium]
MSHPGIDLSALAANAPQLEQRYREFQAMNLSLDMTRGKPCSEQLDLAGDMLNIISADEYKSVDGVDCRNYGGLDGIPEAKALFAPLLGVQTSEIFIGGNTSLGLMHDIIARCMSHGAARSTQPWSTLETVKFLCPSPGYDRHFAICEHFGIEMITIDMLPSGDPDMDQIEALVANDEAIKGIWLVPKYSNPTGSTLSPAAVERFATMACAAADFTIMWDNAYVTHHLYAEHDQLDNILTACQQAGNNSRVFVIGSTSKITFAGAGVAMIGGDIENINWLKKHASVQTIGADKIN